MVLSLLFSVRVFPLSVAAGDTETTSADTNAADVRKRPLTAPERPGETAPQQPSPRHQTETHPRDTSPRHQPETPARDTRQKEQKDLFQSGLERTPKTD